MHQTLRETVRDQQVWVTTPEATVAEAVRLMVDRNIGALPVLARDRMVGIFTERDVLRRVLAEGKDPAGTLVADVMTREPRSVDVTASLKDAIGIMQELHCRHLPVLCDGKLAGLVGLRTILPIQLEEKDAELRDLREYLEYLPPEPGLGG